jgi:biotin synthase-like enzyme
MYIEIYHIDKAVKIAAYLDAIMRANAGTLEEVIEMSDTTITLEQVFEKVGWIAKWEARGKELEAIKIAKNMIKQELPFETIVSVTQLDPEKVKELYQ